MTMTITTNASAESKPGRFEVRSPGTGELLGSLPIQSAEEIQAAVARGRRAFRVWGSLTPKQRRAHLLDYRRELVRRMDDIIDIVHRENGKPRVDAASELMLVVSHLTHAANRAEALLKPRRAVSALFANFVSQVSYHPHGVIGVIGPWNFPLHTPMGSISYALATGNTVVFKPSELTPLCGKILVECAQAAIPIPDVLQLVTGLGETGAALARAKVDKLAFTGSAATGRRVMAAAAENLTPVVLELGGKDPAIITADADLARAAKSVTYGAFWNAGQACVGIERAFVVDSVHDAFVEKVVSEARALKVGDDDLAHYGPMTLEKQVSIVREHVKEALEQGARAVLGGLDSFKGRFIEPVVLVDVTPRMKVMREESFGPVLPIMRVSSAEEAVRLANESDYGLGSAVFAREGAQRIADALDAGMTSINAVLAFAAMGPLPFGGRRESGFGRIHGDDGMREFVWAKATTRELFPMPGFAMVFSDPARQLTLMRKTLQTMFGGDGLASVGSALRKWTGRT
jgi:acyl-CoA reductase-like NAD-dependent aldehyde dehydrogenase